MERYEESREPAQKALVLFPDMVEALVQLGNIYSEEKNYDEAMAAYNRAIQINPNHAATFTNRGIAYHNKNENEKAIADYTEAIQLEPDYAIVFYNRAKAYYAQREWGKAAMDKEEAIRLCPGLAVLDYPSISCNNVAPTNLSKGDLADDKEIEDLTKAIIFLPNSAKLFNNRACAYIAYGEYDKAIADWSEAIRLEPKNVSFLGSRGGVYAKKKGDYAKAIADYTEIIRLAPASSNAFKKRGDAYQALGQYDKAAADHEEAAMLEQEFKKKYPDLLIKKHSIGRACIILNLFRHGSEESETVKIRFFIRF
jgi:tetratricopeptide (TPR) repeat protein